MAASREYRGLNVDRHARSDAAIQRSLERLRQGEASARDTLLVAAINRMHDMAHRMVRGFPTVRRWEDTDDVVQQAALRLHRALHAVVPGDCRQFFGLAALQVRRTLLDLARTYASSSLKGIFLAGQEYGDDQGGSRRQHGAPRPLPSREESADSLQRWTRFHEAAASLPAEERELFDLAWYMGLQQREIAEVLGCSLRTVKRRWDSAKKLLREAAGDGSPLDADESP